MAKNNARHVVPGDGGGWSFEARHNRRAPVAKSQGQAERRAKQIVANQGGARHAFIGNDLNPQNDRKH